MSATEAPKPVEETPAAAPAAEPAAAEPAPATEPAPEAPAAETTETTEAAAPAAETTEAAAEPPKEEAKEEVTPATDGTLGYKAPGLVKSLRFTKRFFYFSEEPIEAKSLTSYLASEKSAAAAQRTAAWATQTGKGLFFYTKRAEDKATPAGIFNLSEVTDISKEGSNEFLFKTNGQKYAFQASSTAERDSWIAALTAKSTEAEAEKEAITGSEGYKAELEKLTKPATAAKPAAAPEKEAKEGEPAAEDKKEEKKEEKKEDKKSRSQSRKRASIFGSILGGKKEKEEVKEETPATTEAAPAEEATPAAEATTEAAPAEGSAETPAAEEAAPAAASAEAETPAETPAEGKKEEKKDEQKAAAKSKRTSIFGNFFNKVSSPSKEKTEEEVTPVSSTAPQLQSPVEETTPKPAESEAAPETPAAEPAVASSSTPPAAETTEKKEETTPEAKDKRRTSLFGTIGKKVKSEVNPDKLGGLFRKPSKAVKTEEEKKEAAPAETIAEGEDKPDPISKDTPEEGAPAATEKTEEPAAPAVAAEPVDVAPAAAPVQAAA